MKHLLLALLTFTMHFVNAQSSYDLDYFIEQAIQNNPALIDNENQIKMAQIEQNRLSKEISGLKVYATADLLVAPYFNNRKLIDTNPESQAIGYDAAVTNGGLYAGLIHASKPLFTTSTYNAFAKAQKAVQTKQQANYSLTKAQLIRNITDQYIQVFKDQQLIAMNTQLHTVLKDQELIVIKLVSAGLLKQSDVVLIELEKKNQQIELVNLTNQKTQDLLDLFTLCGITDTTEIKVDAPALTVTEKKQSQFYLASFKADSLTVSANQEIFNTRYRPQVNVYGDAGINAVQLNQIQRKAGFSVGLSLTMPLYDGRQRSLNHQKVEIAQNTISQYESVKELEVDNNRSKYMQSIELLTQNIEALKKQKQDYKILFEQFKTEIKIGQLSVIDYINSLKVYRNFQLKLINLKADLMMKKNALNYWSQ